MTRSWNRTYAFQTPCNFPATWPGLSHLNLSDCSPCMEDGRPGGSYHSCLSWGLWNLRKWMTSKGGSCRRMLWELWVRLQDFYWTPRVVHSCSTGSAHLKCEPSWLLLFSSLRVLLFPTSSSFFSFSSITSSSHSSLSSFMVVVVVAEHRTQGLVHVTKAFYPWCNPSPLKVFLLN